jgi:hypothetical protein
MKNTFFSILTVLFFSASVNAQSTVDSIRSKYTLLPMPEALTIEKTFPALGQYQLNNAASSAVIISLDSSNKGIIWVEGLAEGKVKAYLKKAPGTYRIPVQKTSSGKSISEGTLIYDRDNNVLNIAIGGGYNEADPAAIFPVDASVAPAPEETKVKLKKGSTKTKTKIVYYSAAKLNPASTTAASNE